MATIVNNPDSSDEGRNGLGFLAGLVLLLVVGFLFLTYAVPAMRNNAPGNSVPEQVDINMSTTR